MKLCYKHTTSKQKLHWNHVRQLLHITQIVSIVDDFANNHLQKLSHYNNFNFSKIKNKIKPNI